MNESLHYLYVIASIENGVPAAPCKIGITSKLLSRLSRVQTGNSKKLEIISYIVIPTRKLVQAVEQEIHEHFAEFRLVGEWFDLPPVDAAIGVCTIAHDAFMAIIPDQTQAHDALSKLGIVDEISRCFSFIERCQRSGVLLDTRFNRGLPLN